MASVKSALQKLPLLPGLITVLVVAVLTILPVAGAAAGCQRILVKTSAETFLISISQVNLLIKSPAVSSEILA